MEDKKGSHRERKISRILKWCLFLRADTFLKTFRNKNVLTSPEEKQKQYIESPLG